MSFFKLLLLVSVANCLAFGDDKSILRLKGSKACSAISDCHSCAVSGCNWESNKCSKFANSTASSGVESGLFFEQVKKCKDTQNNCVSTIKNGIHHWSWAQNKTIPQHYFCYHTIQNSKIRDYGIYLRKTSDKVDTRIYLKENVLDRKLKNHTVETLAPTAKYFDDKGIDAGILNQYNSTIALSSLFIVPET